MVLSSDRLVMLLGTLWVFLWLGGDGLGAGIERFYADDATVVRGTRLVLNWEVGAEVTSLAITPVIGDVMPVTSDGVGRLAINPGPTVNTVYTLSADGPGGPQSAVVTVVVGDAPVIRAFHARVDEQNPASRRLLSWEVANASRLEISPGVGRVPVSGSGLYEIVGAGAEWQYLDDGSDLGQGWGAVGFDDSGWSTGLAELGYGERDEATVVGFGGPASAKAITTYFRKTFTRTAVDTIEQLLLGIRYDDGAVVFLNGVEVARLNLPAGTIGADTPALGDVIGDANDYEFMVVPPALLREGRNVLAVEVHQSRPASSDMSFDLMLEGWMGGELAVVPPGNTTYVLSASNQFGTATSELEVVVSARPLVAFGFDGGLLKDVAGTTAALLEGAAQPALVDEPRRHGDGAIEFRGAGGVRISGRGALGGLVSSPVGDAFSLGLWIKAEASLAAGAVVLDGGIQISKADPLHPSSLCVELPNDQELLIDDVIDGAWHHLALIVISGTPASPGEATLWRDGSLVDSQVFTGGALGLPDDWVVGRSRSGAGGFVGGMDDLVIFDRAISPGEVAALISEAAVSFLVPEIFSFVVDDESVIPGAEVKLSWLTVDADEVRIGPAPGVVDVIGEAIVSPSEATSYVLTASNAHGSATRVVSVMTGPAPVVRRFTISPETVAAVGGVADLRWEVSGAAEVVIDHGVGDVAASGEWRVSPTSLTTYRLTASNEFGTSSAAATAAVVDEAGGEAWTLVIIPDTQHYSDNVANAPIFTEITSWIVAHRETHNIRFVLQEGDIVEHNAAIEWDRARASLSVLDGQVPYALTTGNHDLGPGGNASTRDGEFNLATRFGRGSPYAAQATLGGYYDGSGDPAYRESTYHTFNANGYDYLVLALEWSPRDEVVEWANSVVAAHPSHRAILLTHMLVTEAGQRWTANVGVGNNNGEALWQKLVSKHENFIMTANGHALSLGYLSSLGEQGNRVHQMLFNAQSEPNGGDGWIRLLEFQPDGLSVEVKTYSPHLEALGLGAWRSDPANQFTLELSRFPDVDSDGDLIPDGWEAAHGLDPADAGDAALDPNGNGLNNFFEYANGGRPFASAASPGASPFALETGSPTGHARIRFRRRIPGTASLGYVLEKSCDLKRWSADPGDGSVFAEMSAQSNGDATETVLVEDRGGESGAGLPVFYRLRVTGGE